MFKNRSRSGHIGDPEERAGREYWWSGADQTEADHFLDLNEALGPQREGHKYSLVNL